MKNTESIFEFSTKNLFSAIVIVFLIIFLLILLHISRLDDSFCGCVLCKLQNSTFCLGTYSVTSIFGHQRVFYPVLVRAGIITNRNHTSMLLSDELSCLLLVIASFIGWLINRSVQVIPSEKLG